MVTMADKLFVDTNVLLSLSFPELDHHKECDSYLRRVQNDQVELWISGQIIREFYHVATHPCTFEEPKNEELVVQQIETFPGRFHIADECEEVRSLLPELLREYKIRGKTTHDTNIIATMLIHCIGTVCTLDRHFKRFRNRVFVVDRTLRETK